MWASLWGAVGRWELAAHRTQEWGCSPRRYHSSEHQCKHRTLPSVSHRSHPQMSASNVAEQDPRNTQESPGLQTGRAGTAQGRKKRQKTNDLWEDRTWQSNTQTSKNTLEGPRQHKEQKVKTLSLRDTRERHSKNKLAQKTHEITMNDHRN